LLRGGARPPTPVLIAFITDHKGVFGVEPICRVLSQHGRMITPSTFYDDVTRPPSRRAVRDTVLKELIAVGRGKPIIARLGARKQWLRLRRHGHDVARCTVERLMREMGIHGVRRGRVHVTTRADPAAARPADRVDRDCTTTAPNQLWVADSTYVPTWSGFSYVAFIIDAHSRRFISWRCATRVTTSLALDIDIDSLRREPIIP